MPKKKQWDRIYYEWNSDSDFSRKTGIHPAILFSIETEGDVTISVKEAMESNQEKSPFHSRILREGPLWDCMSAGTDLVISEPFKEFLGDRAPSDLDFLQIYLKGKENSKKTEGYYAVVFKKLLKAITDYSNLDREMIVNSGNKVMVVCDKEHSSWSAYFIEADLAEEMIRAGFTSLGFDNAFTSKKPGRQGKETRVFPEEEFMEQYLREDPSRLISKIANSSTSLKDGWDTLLKEGASIIESQVWTKLKRLDIETDLENQVRWLEEILKREPPQKSIRAFWFGRFDRIESDDSGVFATLYVCGSETYDEEERFDFVWACNPKWFPEDRFNTISSPRRYFKGSQESALA